MWDSGVDSQDEREKCHNSRASMNFEAVGTLLSILSSTSIEELIQ